jgi:hypothetical protein
MVSKYTTFRIDASLMITYLAVRVHEPEVIEEILDIFQSHGHTEVMSFMYTTKRVLIVVIQVDTARFYARGTSEEMLAQLDWQKRGLVMETKLYPTGVSISQFVCIDTSLTVWGLCQVFLRGQVFPPGIDVIHHTPEVYCSLY